ncbi:TPA: hypothetical protein ACHOT2_004998, partial [Escherichia coli]
HYFCEIEFIYSSSVDGGKVKFSAEMQKLYCYVSDWEKSGGICFETQTKLSKVCGCSRKTVNELIGLMIKIGLLEEVGERIPKRPLKLRALPLTDAHITAPREAKASVNAEKPQTEQVSTVKAVPEQLPPTEDKKTLETTRSIQQEKTELPWGGVTICKPNGQPTEAALEWALAETQGDNIEAYRLISIVVSEFTGREHIYTIPETEEDDFDIPF